MRIDIKQAEAWGRLTVAAIVVGLVLWLIVADPVLSGQAQILLRILLSFALAVLTANMVGLIEISGKHLGWEFKAAGGFAIFLVTYFFTPSLLSPLSPRNQASLEIAEIRLVDLRSIDGPGTAHGADGGAGVAITVPLDAMAVSKISPVDPALIKGAMLKLAIDTRQTNVPWSYFVEMIQGKAGTWLSSGDGPKIASGYPVPLNSAPKREVMFLTDKQHLNWSQVLEALRNKDSRIEMTLEIETQQSLMDKVMTLRCSIAGGAFATHIEKYVAQHQRIPLRATIPCGAT